MMRTIISFSFLNPSRHVVIKLKLVMNMRSAYTPRFAKGQFPLKLRPFKSLLKSRLTTWVLLCRSAYSKKHLDCKNKHFSGKYRKKVLSGNQNELSQSKNHQTMAWK